MCVSWSARVYAGLGQCVKIWTEDCTAIIQH